MNETNQKMYDSFTKMYPVSKTLKFELKPIGNTLKNLKENNVFAEDEKRAQNSKKAKQLMDLYHKYFIENVLSKFKFDVEKLNEYVEHSTSSNMALETKKDEQTLRTELISYFKKEEDFEKLFKKDIIEKILPTFLENREDREVIAFFSKFTTYFTGYFNNRKNMYSDEEKSTSIAYRIVNENLPIFISNAKKFNYIYSILPVNAKKEIDEKLLPYLKLSNIEQLFMIDNFNNVLTQAGIDKYNELIGGVSLENNQKIKGLNEYINECKQNNKADRKIVKLEMLRKQILSDSTRDSFIFEKYEKDEQVLDDLKKVISVVDNIEKPIKQLFNNFNCYDLSRIYISNNMAITEISSNLYSDWGKINNCLNDWYDNNSTEKNKNSDKYLAKRKAYFKNIKNMSIEYLNSCTNRLDDYVEIENYFINKNVDIFEDIRNSKNELQDILTTESNQKLKQDESTIAIIKNYLDSVKLLQLFLKPLSMCRYDNSIDKDEEFYESFFDIWDKLFILDEIYNKTRNYVTGKPYSTDKIKLNFNIPTLLNGWDISKESDNKSIILKKNGKFYLAIMDKSQKGTLETTKKCK